MEEDFLWQSLALPSLLKHFGQSSWPGHIALFVLNHIYCSDLLMTESSGYHGGHQLGPLGRVRLVVAKSVCVLFACMSPSHAIFFRLLIGPVITWSVQSLSLVIPSPPSPPFFSFSFFLFWRDRKKRGKKKKLKKKKKLSCNLLRKKKLKSRNLLKFGLVLLSASVERVGVSCMRDFFISCNSET